MNEIRSAGWDKIFSDGVFWPDMMEPKLCDTDAVLKLATDAAALKAALEEAKKSCLAVPWPVYNPHPSAAEVAKVNTECEAFIKGGKIVKLRAKLTSLLNTIKIAAQKDKSSSKLKAAFTKLTQAATFMLDCLEANELMERLERAQAVWREKKLGQAIRNITSVLPLVAPTAGNVKGTLDELVREFQAIEEELTPEHYSRFGNSIRSAARSMTQILGNTLKATEAGVTLNSWNEKKAQTLWDTLTPIGNSKHYTDFMEETRLGVGQTIKKLGKSLDEFKSLYQNVTIG